MKTLITKFKPQLKNKIFIGTLSYLILIVSAIFILNIKSLVISDGLSQYTALIHNSIGNLTSGNFDKLIYDSTLGFGQPFINILVYYGFSPFNILLLLPFMTMSIVIIIKLSVLAFTVNYVFSKKFKELSLLEHCFLTLIFLTSSSVLVNVLSFIWLDSIIGMVALLYFMSEPIKHRNIKIFTITIVMIWSNFYLSIILLLFIGILALLKGQFKSAFVIVLSGLLSIAPIILGSYQNLITRGISQSSSPALITSPDKFLTLILQILLSPAYGIEAISKYMNFAPFIGTYSLLFIFLLWSIVKSYKYKETWVIGIMGLSMISPKLNAILHGGQLPSGWNYRFSPLIFILMLFIFADKVCKNREFNKISFLQMKTLIPLKTLSKIVIAYLTLLLITLVTAIIWKPNILKDVSPFIYIFTLFIFISLIIGIIALSKEKFTLIKFLSFGYVILSVFVNFTILYKMDSEDNYATNINTMRHDVGMWESKQSNKTLLNNIIQISNNTSTLIEPSISQNSAFVTPVSPYIALDKSIYLVDANRVKYNALKVNPISNLIYGANFEFSPELKTWSRINNLDRGFVLDGYKNPKTTEEFVELLSNDSLNHTDLSNVRIKSKDNFIDVSLSKTVPEKYQYIIKFKSASTFVKVTDLNLNKTNETPFFGNIIIKPGDHLQIHLSNKEFHNLIDTIYLTPKHFTPRPSLKNTFEITSGQNKTQILKGNSYKSGDLILRVLYDKNISATVNGNPVKVKRGFGAFILIQNINKGDIVTLSYTNPIIKPVFIYTIFVIIFTSLGYIIWYLHTNTRRIK